ncbi:MAG: RND family transporter, partial [Calditrichia bacterium]
NPEYLKVLDEFSKWLGEQPEVIQVSVVSDIFKRLNKSMHGDDHDYYRVPEKRDLAAQYLLLYEMSLPFGLDLNNRINVDKSATRVQISLDKVYNREIRVFEKRARTWLEEHAFQSMHAQGTGISMMFAYINKRNVESMLRGTFLALVLISVILVFALRSVKIGLISLIPNLVPAIMSFGLWGITVSRVGLAVSVVAAISLGIVVDDTVHFLSKYLRARREQGMDSESAVRYAFHNVGRPLVITSLILIAGFGVLTFSGFKVNANMGILTAIAIAFALCVDFLLLPPILMNFDRKKKVEPSNI